MPWPTGGASPDPDLLVEGAGIFYFDRDDADGNPTGPLDMGNTERLELTTDDTVIEKFSSRTKARPRYKRSLQRRAVTLRTTFDEFSPDNVALMLQGSIEASTAQAATAVVAQALTPLVNGVRFGGYYRIQAFGPFTGITVKKASTPLVLGTDYTLITVGNVTTVHILPVPTLAGLAEGDDLTVGYTPTAYTDGFTVINGGTEGRITGSGLYVSDNTEGPNFIIEFWKLSASPDGAIGYISDDFATMGVQFALEDDSANHPANPLYKKTYVP